MAAKKKKRKAGAKSAPQAWAWKLVLIPFAFVFYKLLDFVKEYNCLSVPAPGRFLDALGNGEFTANVIIQAAWIIGLILLLLSDTRRQYLLIPGLLLFLMPAWYCAQPAYTVESAKVYKGFEFLAGGKELVRLGFEVGTALWACALVRGSENTQWLKAALGILLMAGNLYCYKNGGPLDWKEYIEIISMAALTGWAVDFALNGFSLAGLLPAAVCVLEVFLWDSVSVWPLWITAGLCAAGIIALLATSPVKNRSFGGIVTLAGVGLNSVLTLLLANAGRIL
ncbi:MAG: hypothetical protein IKR85_07900 [Clostridia bacterium]|nr:hypothetical protein [Clostridia bacterium]